MTYILNAAKYYVGEPHQVAAWEYLWESLDEYTQESFKEAYSASPEPVKSNPLQVKYFYQNDNASGTGYRECYSSSCAMLAAFYGKVSSDDEYNVIRSRFGDSTNTAAQLSALDYLGLKASFHTNGSSDSLRAEIDAQRPVAVGWLHKGSVSYPSGGGHWSVVIGYTNTSFILNDPNGEASLVGGGYSNYTNGAGIQYSYKNWLPRWEVEGSNTGWYLTCSV
jgi:hypothetical protein